MKLLARIVIICFALSGILWIAINGHWWARLATAVLVVACVVGKMWWVKDPHAW